MSTKFTRGAWAALLATMAGCGAAQRPPVSPLRPLTEVRALEVIREGFDLAHVAVELHHHVQLAGGHDLEVDFATPGHPHGVEYVGAQDRADFGDVIPARLSAGALVTVTGTGPDASFDVLILDDRDFMFQPDASQTGPGAPTSAEVEDRLRRAVVDYLTYLQSHHELGALDDSARPRGGQAPT